VILIDSGPMVAIIDPSDTHHQRAIELLSGLPTQPFLTTWPCISESMHIVGSKTGWRGQDALWEMIARGILIIHVTELSEYPRMRELMAKYADAPMDLADASLISLAEVRKLKRIMSFDDHFYIYRIAGTESFDVIR
jgi:uncharacterized protein